MLANWQRRHAGNLKIVLPDTYGTQGFLADAPDWVGIRIGLTAPIEGGEEAIRLRQERGRDPCEKLAIFSDGLDIDAIECIHGRGRIGYGRGTLLTNDFSGLVPDGALDPISIVCKVTHADGRPTVKLSDNLTKAQGPADVIARYRRVCSVSAQAAISVVV